MSESLKSSHIEKLTSTSRVLVQEVATEAGVESVDPFSALSIVCRFALSRTVVAFVTHNRAFARKSSVDIRCKKVPHIGIARPAPTFGQSRDKDAHDTFENRLIVHWRAIFGDTIIQFVGCVRHPALSFLLAAD